MNRRVRAGCVVGLLVLSGGAVSSCGSADTSNLFSAASVSSSSSEGGSVNVANHAGSVGVAGTEAGGPAMQSGGSAGTGHGGGASGGSATGGANSAGSSGSAAQGGTSGSAGHAGMTGMGGAGGSAGLTGGSGFSAGGAGDGAGGNSGSGGSAAGSAGNGGTAGSAGAAAGSAGAAAGSGGSGPASCTSNAGCGASEYCAKTECAAQAVGTCTAKPSAMDCTNVVAAPVCGCDGLTYHDACLLHANRQNSLPVQPAGGVCSNAAAGTVTCSAFDTTSCSLKNGVCSWRDDTCSGFGNPAAVAVCWVLPATCPAADPKLMVGCSGGGSCRSECAEIKSGVQSGARYALSDSCP